MRNEPKPLDRTRAARAYNLRDGLEDLKTADRSVRLDYYKRNGERSASSGKVMFFNGRDGMDTMSVTIDDPAKGARTVNLDLIITVKPL